MAPDRQVEVTMDRCPDCWAELGSPFRIDSKHIVGRGLLYHFIEKEVHYQIDRNPH